MNRRQKTFLFLCTIMLAGAPLFAATIRLNNGTVVEGDIVKEDERSILVETDLEWKRILKTDIQSVTGGEQSASPKTEKEGKPEEQAVKAQSGKLECDFGPGFGVYMPLESNLSRYHKTGLFWGVDATLWKKQNGFSIEYGQYKSTYQQSQGYAVGYQEDLTILPLWLSLLHRGKGKVYGFFGAGIGLTTVKLFVNVPMTYTSSYTGYQLLGGIRGERVGATVKYSFLDTSKEWGSGINFSALSVLLEIML